MKQQLERSNFEQPSNHWTEGPDRAPAIFVIDVLAYDTDGTVRGCWLDPTAPAATITAQIEALVKASPPDGRWAIVDQYGCGARMLPEEISVQDLGRLLQRYRSDVSVTPAVVDSTVAVRQPMA